LVLLSGFSLIACLVIVEGAVNDTIMSQGQVRSKGLALESVQSVDVLNRIILDVERQKIIVDDHIFEQSPTKMSGLEQKLARLTTDLVAARNSYASTVTLPGEAPEWRRAQVSLDRLPAFIEATLALSRVNRDREARVKWLEAGAEYEALDGSLTRLVQINSEGALKSISRISAINHRSAVISGRVRLATLAFLLLLVVWMTRRIRRYEGQLEELAGLLEARNRDLDAFAGRVAHDLRNALSPIELFVGQLQGAAVDQSRVLTIAERVERSSAKAMRLIDALLAFSRAPAAPAADERCLVPPVVESVLASVVPAEAFTVETRVADVAVRCRAELLEIVLSNLVGNAVKFLQGQAERRIEVSAVAEDGICRIEVADNGPGIPKEAQARIFEPFFRVEGATAPGTGIGLATVLRIVETRGGRVSVESEAGRGSRFSLWLPRALDRPDGSLSDTPARGWRGTTTDVPSVGSRQ
jgi:signal transduction histidine kinase